MIEHAMAWPFVPNWALVLLAAVAVTGFLLMVADEPSRNKRLEWLGLPMLGMGIALLFCAGLWNMSVSLVKLQSKTNPQWTQRSDPYQER